MGFATGDAPTYFGYFGQGLEQQINADLDERRVMLMGRVTYEDLAEISGSGEHQDLNRMAELPKVVSSNTLEEPPRGPTPACSAAIWSRPYTA